MGDLPDRDPAIEFYYYGFLRVLRRFRFWTIVGWLMTAAGIAAVALRWKPLWQGDVPAVLISILALAGGIGLVQISVTALMAYVSVPFPGPDVQADGDAGPTAVGELRALMSDVEAGGWQEAMGAIREARTIGDRYGIPPPENGHN